MRQIKLQTISASFVFIHLSLKKLSKWNFIESNFKFLFKSVAVTIYVCEATCLCGWTAHYSFCWRDIFLWFEPPCVLTCSTGNLITSFFVGHIDLMTGKNPGPTVSKWNEPQYSCYSITVVDIGGALWTYPETENSPARQLDFNYFFQS